MVCIIDSLDDYYVVGITQPDSAQFYVTTVTTEHSILWFSPSNLYVGSILLGNQLRNKISKKEMYHHAIS